MYCVMGRDVQFLSYYVVFFFRQKTAYEMRISDWSSDVCSSDLSRIRTMSPCLNRFSGSCAENFFERVMNFLYSGCMTRRWTVTTTVLSPLSLTTVPCRTRLGIAFS